MIRDYVITIPANASVSRTIGGTYAHLVSITAGPLADISDGVDIRIEAASQTYGTIADVYARVTTEFKTVNAFDTLRFYNDTENALTVTVIAGSGDYSVDSTPIVQTVAITSKGSALNGYQSVTCGNSIATSFAGNRDRKSIILRAAIGNNEPIWIGSGDATATGRGYPLDPGEKIELPVTEDFNVFSGGFNCILHVLEII